MIISIKLKVTIKLGASEMCRIESTKAMKFVVCCKCTYVHVKCSHSYVQNTPQPCCQSMSLTST